MRRLQALLWSSTALAFMSFAAPAAAQDEAPPPDPNATAQQSPADPAQNADAPDAAAASTEDSAIVVRAKFTARPGNNAWVVRRVAYDKIIRAFRTAGIKFAHREVTVNVPPSQVAETAHAVAGAAAGAVIAKAKGGE